MTPTREQYDAAFNKERANTYPNVTRFEASCGFAVDRERLEAAARVLACPVKENPPCWQHGRVIYAAARRALVSSPEPHHWLDIGTAKGFSACVMAWAAADAGALVPITSLDVIHPLEIVARNSVEDLDGLQTVPEIASPFLPPAHFVHFGCSESIEWLECRSVRINLAFVDGRHKHEVVAREIDLLSARQQPGDVIIFDDVQIAGVARALSAIKGYDVHNVQAHTGRGYAVATKL
jgi:hypothetical protein